MERLNSELADTLRDRQHLLELAEAGCADIKTEGTTTNVEGLTSYGRSYFRDLEESERRMWKRIWSDRRFQIGLSIITLALSGVISLGVSLLVSLLT